MWIMASIKQGYVHLLNTESNNLTLSDTRLDVVLGGIGGYLEDALGKILDNHNRRSGTFKPISKLKEKFESYANDQISFKELTHQVAKEIFKAKENEKIREKTTLFVLEGQESVYALEVKRNSQFIVKSEESSDGHEISIYSEELALGSIRANSISFFEVNLDDMSVSTLEKLSKNEIFLFSDVILKASMSHSLNQYVADARQAFYNAVIEIEDRSARLCDFKKKADVSLLNSFEEKINDQVKKTKEIDFAQIAKEVFYYDPQKCEKFIELLRNYNIFGTIEALSQAPIKLVTIDYAPKVVHMENGIKILIPDDFPEQELNIQLKIDEKLKEAG